MLWLKTLILFIAGLSNILVALAVLSRGVKKLNNISFFIVSVAMGGWTLGIALFLLSDVQSMALTWARMYYVCPAIVVVALAIFVQTFPDRNRISRSLIGALTVVLLTLVVPIIVMPNSLLQALVYHEWGKEIVLGRYQYLIYSAFLLLGFPISLAQLYQRSRQEKGIYAVQAELFFVGFAVALVFGLIFNLFLPWLGNYRLIWVGPLFTSFFIAAIAYSIIRHRMFNLRLIVARSVGYVLAVITLLVGYGLLSFGAMNRLFFKDDPITSGQAAAFTSLAVLLAFTLPAARKFFNRFTNSIFYRDAYDPQGFIDQLNRVLATNIELSTLLHKASDVIKANLKAEYCLFIIERTSFRERRTIGVASKAISKNDMLFMEHAFGMDSNHVLVADYLSAENSELNRVMTRNDVAALIRISPESEGADVGYILLGQKRSGNPYTEEDIRILETVSKELLIATQNALHVEEIEQFNLTLQEKIDEATRQLRHTNEKLRQLDQTKDDFISMASHQLRTPLTSVKGYVSMVLDGDAGKISPLQRKLLNQSFVSSQRMVYLISDLLNVSRLRTGKFVIEPVPTNLAKVIQDEVEQLQETAKGRNLTLAYSQPEHFPTFLLDETKLRQVIMNFMDNAIYYTPSGGHITVNLVEKPQTIEFTVVDNGIGVPRHEQHHLFSKFYRAHNAKRARPDGTGLGLFMAKKVIVAQGGATIFRSQEKKGSTFGFTFAKSHLQQPAPIQTQDL